MNSVKPMKPGKKKASKNEAAKGGANTPMMRHYLQLKEENPDAILLYRCGDFYELFFQDAVTASRELDITLTSRDRTSEEPVPMAGVPYHAVNQYISRLIDKGYKVAICEQMEDPKLAKGMVKRDIAQVITPGIVMDPENLDATSNNYLLSIAPAKDGKGFGLGVVDVSTGEFRCAHLPDEASLRIECAKLAPREVLVPESLRASEAWKAWFPFDALPLANFRLDQSFDEHRSLTRLKEHFQTETLAGFGVDGIPTALAASGALLEYIQETQRQEARNLLSLRPYRLDEFMVLDETAKRNLELERTLIDGRRKGSLLGLMDQSVTALGSRTLRSWINYPLCSVEPILDRQEVVSYLVRHPVSLEHLRDILRGVADLQRLGSRVALLRASPRDMVSLRDSLDHLAMLVEQLDELGDTPLKRFVDGIDPMSDVFLDLDVALMDEPPQIITDGGMFKLGFNAELDELIDLATHGKDQILRLEAKEREKTGIPTLKVRYNRVFGYYLEVSKANADKVPSDWMRKQTLTNAERFINEELKDFEEKVLGATEKRNDLERKLFEELRARVALQIPRLFATADVVGNLDALQALAMLAVKNSYVCPEVNEGTLLSIEAGRHPVVEQTLTDDRFVPNDLYLDCENQQVMVITGPNMAGKSTVMRQAALIVLMAQMGSFVPARACTVGVVDRIFTRVGASDSLHRGLSTFMVEMTETANILHNATGRSLIVLDEIGRGTSTFDGLSIAWAVAEHLHDVIGAKTLFATHYHELTTLAERKARVQNFNIAVKEWMDHIVFLRKLVEGATNKSYGVKVGELAGLPKTVIDRAGMVLKRLERGEFFEPEAKPSAPATKQAASGQLSLFGPTIIEKERESRIDEALRNVDIDTLTPLEALNLVHHWKRTLNKH